MSHQIESLFYAKETPWHGLGTYVGEEAITSAEAITASGLDWEVQKQPMFTEGRMRLLGTAEDPYTDRELIEVPNQFAMVRDSDHRVLGTVGNRYQVVQNREAFEFLDSVAGEGAELRYNTAGSLKEGAMIWLLAELDDALYEPVPGDPVKPYLLFSNTHDGSGAVRAFQTSTRVVCANTYNMALRADGKGTQAVSIRHTGNIQDKIRSAQEIMGLAVSQAHLMADAFKHLASRHINNNSFDGLLDVVSPLPVFDKAEGKFVTSPTKSQNVRDTITELFESGTGSDIKGVRGTAWAAFNAVTEYTNHHRTPRGLSGDVSKEKEKRLESVWFGSGAAVNDKAFAHLMVA